MQLSNEQNAVVRGFNDVVSTGENLRVHALAGTGKTTLLRKLSHEGHARKLNGLYLTFNRESADSAGLARSCPSFNWHRLAARLLKESFGTRVSEYFSATGVSEPELASRLPAVRALGMDIPRRWAARQVVRAISVARLTEAFEVLPEHVRLTDTDRFPEGAAALRVQIASAANFAVAEGLVPFAHADYLKQWATMPSPFAGLDLDYVLVDEAQDLPVLLGDLLRRVGCTVVLVGDRFQFLNAYAGASIDSMDDSAFGDILPLTKSWRFGSNIADLGNEALEALGSELFLDGVGAPAPASDTVHLVGTNKQAFDLSEALDAASPRVVGSERLSRQRSELLRLRADRDSRSDTFAGLGFDDLAESPNLFPDVAVLLASLDHPDFSSLANDSECLISTIHKFKGLEASHVFLHRNAIPDDKTVHSAMLRYVAVTRAKMTLEIV